MDFIREISHFDHSSICFLLSEEVLLLCPSHCFLLCHFDVCKRSFLLKLNKKRWHCIFPLVTGLVPSKKEKKIYVLYIRISHYQVLEILKIPKIFCNSNLTGSTSLPGSLQNCQIVSRSCTVVLILRF